MFSPNSRTTLICRHLLLAISLLTIARVTSAERLPIKTYTTSDGLWSSAINYLARDSRGFMWFCTRDGLSRFDGYQFVNYKLGDDPSQSFVSSFYETRRGVYWIVTNGGGLYQFDPNASTAGSTSTAAKSTDGRVLLNAQLVSSKFFSTLVEDGSGTLWAGGDELLRVEDQNGRIEFHAIELNLPSDLKQDLTINSIVAARDGTLWLGTTKGLLRRWPDGSVAHTIVHPQAGVDVIKSLLEDQDGRIWFVHDYPAELYVLNAESMSEGLSSSTFVSRPLRAHQPVALNGQRLLPNKPGESIDYTTVLAEFRTQSGRNDHAGVGGIWAIYQASDGRVWIASAVGLIVYEAQRFRRLLDEAPVNSGFAEDLDGDVWIGGLNGVVRVMAEGLVTYDVSDGLKGDAQINAIYEDGKGTKFVVNSHRLISQLDDHRFKSVQPRAPDTAWYIWTSNVAFLDHAGEWWLLTDHGLYRFNHINQLDDLGQRKPIVYTMRDGLPSGDVYRMFEDSRGDLWISTRHEPLTGLARWQRSAETFHEFTAAEGYPSGKSAASFAEDGAGSLWFGFYQGGLVRYSAGHFVNFTQADGLPEGFITGLHLDQKGRLWLTSNGGGLSRIDDPTAPRLQFVSYTTKDGLSSNNARCLTEDLEGRIYVGTVSGVDRLTPESGKIKHYGVPDGLAADFVSTAYTDRKGAVWFGTPNGLSRLDPRSERSQPAPSIAITSLRIGGVEQPLPEFGSAALSGLTLSANQNNVQIDFSSLSIAHAASLRYQYRLEGADPDWSAPAQQRTVTYAKLASGSYRFLVRAIGPEGAISSQPASVSFVILRPVWQRWWFVMLSALLLTGLAYVLFRYRLNRLLELERVRTRIATDLHDDIGSNLSRIAVLSEVVGHQVAEGRSEATASLSKIATTSRELVDSMSDIVWAINPAKDQLSDLTGRMRRFASDLLTARNIDFSFRAPSVDVERRVSADVRRQVFLIFKESINNLVRHSGCTEANIELQVDGRNLALMVRDNGKGFDATRTGDGHGLASMRARAEKLGGRLVIISNDGQGTTVRLVMSLIAAPARDGDRRPVR